MPKNYSLIFKNVALILAGNTLYALAVVCFILPNGLITGGTTGLALLFFHQFKVPIAAFVSVFNIAMFALGALVLGRSFALTTLISTFYYPSILAVFQNISSFQNITSDRLLAAIYAGIMIGVSLGIVLKAGASTGGMDIPPLVINKKSGLSVAIVMYLFDFTILLTQMLYADKEQVLYGILMVLIYTAVLDQVLLFGKSRTQVKIISEKYEEINRLIIQQMDRGSTLLHAETGFQRNENPVILTVVSNRELPRLNNLVLSVDPRAFLVINRVNEVKGRGFTMDKVHQ